MTLEEARIGDRIFDPGAEASPRDGYEIVGIDRQGVLKSGPGVVCTWNGRPPGESLGIIKAKELVRYHVLKRG